MRASFDCDGQKKARTKKPGQTRLDFGDAANYTDPVLIAQTAIDITFLPSATVIACTNKLISKAH